MFKGKRGEVRKFIGRGKLTKRQRIRLVAGVRCAIRLRSQMSDRVVAGKLLAKDIRNSIHHVLGNHTNCSDFCKLRPTTVTVAGEPCEVDEDPDGDEPAVIDDVICMYLEGSKEEEENQAREALSPASDESYDEIIAAVGEPLGRMAKKAPQLLGNFTTNVVESWMTIRAKFDGGKMINRCQSGSWSARCFGAGLRKNLGEQWGAKAWELTTKNPAGYYFWEYGRRVLVKRATGKMTYLNPLVRARAHKRKKSRQVEMTSKKPNCLMVWRVHKSRMM